MTYDWLGHTRQAVAAMNPRSVDSVLLTCDKINLELSVKATLEIPVVGPLLEACIDVTMSTVDTLVAALLPKGQ